ncbi:MAG: 50S ribosomal protein L9, partial [Armatimonadetes bacterium]|nr:50S ribosomal protein L9 [Armatimonadota bacterium]
KEVSRLGHEGDVVEVRDGYARNYLIPRGLAMPATRGGLRDLELRRSAIQKRLMQRREYAERVAEQLQTEPLVIGVLVGERGRLHGRVTPAQIADAIREKWGVEVDRRDIELREPVKAIGDYVVRLRLFRDVAAQITLQVRPIEEVEAAVAKSPQTKSEAAERVAPGAEENAREA